MKLKDWGSAWLTAGLAGLGACAWGVLAQPVRQHTVDPVVTHQVWENFGASDAWMCEPVGYYWGLARKPLLGNLLFAPTNGIALSAWRFNLGGGRDSGITHTWRSVDTFEVAAGRYDWTRCPGQRWFLANAKAWGVPTFIMFANSPPRRLTRNGHTYATDGLGTSNLREGAEAEYARYLVDILRHFRDDAPAAERVSFDYISPVNEPQWEWNGTSQEGTRASNADLVRIYLALQAELQRQGVATRILGVESGSIPDMHEVTGNNRTLQGKYGGLYGDYIWRFVTDPDHTGVAAALGGRIGYHSYWSDDPATQLLPDRRALRQEMDALAAGWKLWMTEYCVLGADGPGRDLGINTALRVARVIQLDLTVAGVSAWQWWTAISHEDYKDGLIYTDWKAAGDNQTYYSSKTLWALGQFSRFIRPGMKRCGFDGEGTDVNGLLGSAWRDDRTGEIVVVYVNMASADAPVSVAFKSRPAPFAPVVMRPYVTATNALDSLRAWPARLAASTFPVPARSVVTLRYQSRPALGASLDPAAGLCVLRWPAWADGYQLTTRTNLAASADWTAVDKLPLRTNDVFEVRVPLTEGGRQFRLELP